MARLHPLPPDPAQDESGGPARRYVLGELIGEGGMGRVYRARDTRLDRDVAVKVLRPGLAADAARRRRFEDEARAAAALAHPNIVAVHDICDQDGVPVIVTELLDGETLRSRLRAGPLPPATALGIATQLARGLAAAHARGIVHCDLKPENVVVTGDGVVKILDFGLARLTEAVPATVGDPSSAAHDTGSDGFVGTVGYMAPEQLRLRPVDGRTDIFAFGCIVREMLTGRPTFAGASPAETIAAVLHADPDPLPPGTGISRALDLVTRRCLEKEPSARYASSRDLLAALEVAGLEIRHGESSAAAPRGRALRVGAALAAIGALAAVIAATPMGRALRSPSVPPRTSVAVLPFQNVSGEAGMTVIADGLTDQLIESLATVHTLDKVIARSSVEGFGENRPPAQEIGAQLDVATLVEGTVQRQGGLVRVAVTVVDAATGAVTWSGSFRRPDRELLELRREVTVAVTRELGAVLSTIERARLAQAVGEVAPAAYDAYLRGKYHYAAWGHPGRVEKAEASFREAIELSPTFGAAWAGLSLCLADPSQGITGELDELYPMARAAADRAVLLDPDDAYAHLARGAVAANMEWDWDAAREHVDRALALSPNDAYVHMDRANVLAVTGDLEAAIAEAERGSELAPLAWSGRGTLAWLNLAAGRTAVARRTCEEWLAREPDNWTATVLLAHADVLDGRLDDAVARVESIGCVDGCAWVWARAGRHDIVDPIIARFEAGARAERTPQIEGLAYLYAGLGDTDAAIHWLGRAAEARSRIVPVLGLLWEFTDLHDDPRFMSLLRENGIPEPPRDVAPDTG